MGKKNSKGGKGGKGCFFIFFIFFLLAVILLAGGAASLMFLPEQYIPAAFQGTRERLLRMIGRQKEEEPEPVQEVRKYQAKYNIKSNGGPEFTVLFAPDGSIEQEIEQFIRGAKTSVCLCMHRMDLASAAEALEEAKRRAVDVQIITDSDFRKTVLMDKLVRCGISVIEDNRPGIMNQRFMVRDARDVWTGSCDFTGRDIQKNDEDVLVFTSPHAASLYLAKFSEYQNGLFGERAETQTMRGRFLAGKVPMQILIAPADPVCSEVVKRISAARKSIRFMAENPDSGEIMKALASVAKRGVSVECIIDSSRTASRFFRDEYAKGCGVKLHAAANENGKMNHNAMIIDGEIVITGSYGFTDSAARYHDGSLVIVSDKALARCYADEFDRCASGGKNY